MAGSTKPATIVADLPSGIVARLEYRPVYSGTALAGGVFRVKDQTPSRPIACHADLQLPGVAGTSPQWRQACATADASFTGRTWLALNGEPGAGKTAMARAVALRHGHRPVLIDCAAEVDDYSEWAMTLADEVTRGGPAVAVLQHAEVLTDEGMQALTSLLTAWQGAPPEQAPAWVVVTLGSGPAGSDVQGWLMPFFAHTVEVPPLRHRIEDLRRLVPHLLARHANNRPLAVSDGCLRQLMRLPWPGNVRGLDQVLAEATRRRRTGTIEVVDLPEECRTFTRRQLTKLETIERDAIVRSLAANRGNKERAAADLGMSRATIYRKIRAFGIAPDHS
jgi:hypothetical protein